MYFIVGGNGLTGSALVRYLKHTGEEYKIIQKENKHEFLGKSCDTLIYANGNALKYKANEEPLFDFHASVVSIAEYIHNIKFKKFIHISTIDVYDNKTSIIKTKEDVNIDAKKLNIYGYHKYCAEEYVKHFCKNYLIFRLSGLVGKGLKKNAIYDFIHKDKKVMLSPETTINYINTRFIAETIVHMQDLGIENQIFNLASKNTIKIRDIENIIGVKTEYTKNAHLYVDNNQINTKKIEKYVKLSSSEEAIIEYFNSLK
tara:strand:- start:218 stop:991 length:774 start_codon:yes stop_codon:yes gene_type:complete